MLIVLREAKSVVHTQPFVSFMPKLADGFAGMLKEVRHAQDTRIGHAPMSLATVGGEQWTENTEQLLQL